MTHYLVTGTSAAEVERKTGLRAHDTPLGTLVEKPQPFRLEVEMERLERILHPHRCTCGAWAIVHQAGCPMWNVIT
jgi:hypothetical protein